MQEHITGSSEEKAKARKRTDACFWNLQSRCSIQVHDLRLKRTKLGYLKKKNLQLRNDFGKMIREGINGREDS